MLNKYTLFVFFTEVELVEFMLNFTLFYCVLLYFIVVLMSSTFLIDHFRLITFYLTILL